MSRFIETGDEQRAKARAEENERFEDWKAAVDRRLGKRCEGQGITTFHTQPYREMFDDGLDPDEAAEYVAGEEGWL